MTELIELVKHANGIHEFIFHDNSRHVVDIYFDKVEAILNALPDGENHVRIIINIAESGMPPFAKMTRHARSLTHDHRAQMAHLHMRGAVLARGETALLLSLVTTFTRLMPIDIELRGFSLTDREKAETWLLS